MLPKYLVYAGYSYSEYCDEDPHEVVKDPTKCTHFIFAPGNQNKTGLYNTYWAASRLGTSGMDGSIVRSLAISYDFTADAIDEKGNPVYSENEKSKISKDCLIESALLGYYDSGINNKAVGNREGAAFVGLAIGNTIFNKIRP